jgi:hypothetical protein
MLIAAALLIAAPPGAPSPEREMLDSVRAACEHAGDMEAMKRGAVAAGWEPIADDADPRVARLNKIGRESVDQDGKIAGGSYRRTIGGRPVFLILSRYDDKSGFWGAGCRLYDFEAAEPMDPAGLQAWMGKPPTGVQQPEPGLSKRLWEPAWRDGITLEVNHVPQGHELGKRFGLQGNILVAQAIGGF